MKTYDAIIIGSGQGGTPLSKKLARLGWKIALIEKEWIGGTCVNVGCTPTKTMIASAKMAYQISQAKSLGIRTGPATVDIKKVLARKNEVVDTFRNGAQKGLEKTANLTIIFGTAIFTGEKEINVDLNKGGKIAITADKIFINVGARPTIPPIKGLEDVDYLTSTSIMELYKIPEHLIIIGGGYIGLEFGQMYRRFGSKVTIIESNTTFLHKEDKDVANCIHDFLQEEKIKILVGMEITEVKKYGEGISISLKSGGQKKSIRGSHLLVAAGRTPNADLLNVNAAGIATDGHGFIIVNEYLQTNVKGVYVMGDVKGGPEFTHISYNDHLVLLKNIVEGKQINYNKRQVPYTMFTDPQLGRVGITEQQARKEKRNIRVATFPMRHVARAIETGDTRGMMKAVVDGDNDTILGVAIIGAEGGELMTVMQMAMLGGITWPQIRELPIAHPLYSESFNNLFMQLEKDDQRKKSK